MAVNHQAVDTVHRPGSKKVYYCKNSGSSLAGRLYLLVLACHQDVFARGVPAISHFQRESYYKALLHCPADKFLSETVKPQFQLTFLSFSFTFLSFPCLSYVISRFDSHTYLLSYNLLIGLMTQSLNYPAKDRLDFGIGINGACSRGQWQF